MAVSGMASNSITLDFERGKVVQDLAMLPERMLDEAYEVLKQQADLMVGLAQVYVRVDTGSLRDSIRVERVAPEHHLHRKVRVRAGGYITNPKTGQLVNYAAIVEAKYPYMRPAWDDIRADIHAMIQHRIVGALVE